VKRLIRSLLRRFGYGVWKIDSPETLNFENLLWSVLQQKGEIFYLQIGANDGVFVDPLYQFLRRHSEQVRGVAVEPVPHTFEKLRTNLQFCKQVQPVCRAIHETLKSVPMYFMKPGLGTERNAHAIGMASFDRNHLLRGGYLTEDDIISEEVECSSLAELILEYSLEDINVLVIDTEGYDEKILSMIDYRAIRPSIIRFEHGLNDNMMSRETLLRITHNLNENGYQVILENYDATAYLL
jgi:FkbM family methyltransferase